MAQASERVADLVEYLVTSLVDQPDEVFIDIIDSDDGTTFELHVAPDDLGKVIGRQGRIIKSIRTLVRAAALSDNARIDIEVIG